MHRLIQPVERRAEIHMREVHFTERLPLKLPRVYVPTESFSRNGVIFPAKVAHYVKNVLRLQTGDHLEAFDGDHVHLVRLEYLGTEVHGELIVSRDVARQSDLDITLAFGCVRPGPFQEILRHGAELGVNRFVPLLTRRTARRPERKKSRWETILTSAVSQSGRTRMPVIEEPIGFDTFISREIAQTDRYILSQRHPTRPFWEALKDSYGMNVIILVGPEGGFDELEEEAAVKASYQPVQIADYTLRTETAAIVGIGLVAARFNYFEKIL